MLEIIGADGNRQFYKSALNLAEKTTAGIEKSWWQTGKDLVGIFNRQVLDKNKTGRVYIRRDRIGRRRRHRSSAAGQSPANRTGNYRKAIGFIVQGRKQLTFGNSAEYAGFLELGTSRMKARPGLGNAVNAGRRDILRNLQSGILKEI